SAISLDCGFHAVSGASACTVEPPPGYEGAFSKDEAESPDGSTTPALRAALISRRISASEAAPAAMCTFPSASTASDDASIRATTLSGCAGAGLDFAAALTVTTCRAGPLGIVASPQPAAPKPTSGSMAMATRAEAWGLTGL